ncbi:GTPase Era [Massilioclostridium coli]|uniref:GTPase Era n=1 Tax=Massilioclostridium coli TaxID=1870991 RepID=UPI0022E596F7|nr:GTPase Era [Massilioclostridium coli]
MIDTRSAFIAIVGKPNVGKSSLLNALTGHKIAIVTNRPQTTRTRITGVLTKGQTQFVFIDTPGLLKAKNKLGEKMVKTVKDSVADVDAAVLVVEPTGEVNKAELDLIEGFRSRKLPAILAVNKIDLVEQKEKLIERIAKFTHLYDFSAVVPISALQEDGVDILLQEMEQFSMESVHFFPDDAVTDQPERVLAGEMLREKILLNMRDEIPHGTAVSIERFQERGDILHIDATIFCERDSHKGMIIGKGGNMLKKIASEARRELEDFFQIQVNLQCWVKVKENWRNREGVMRSLGFE